MSNIFKYASNDLKTVILNRINFNKPMKNKLTKKKTYLIKK